MRRKHWFGYCLAVMMVTLLFFVLPMAGSMADTVNADNAATCVTLTLEPKDGAVFDEGITVPVKLSTTIKMKSLVHDAASYIAGKFGSDSLRFNKAELVLYRVNVTNTLYGTEKNEYVETVLSREYNNKASIIIFNRSYIGGLAAGKYVLKLNVYHTGNICETLATRTFYVQGKSGSSLLNEPSKEPATVTTKPDSNHGGDGKDIVNKEEQTYKYSRWSYYNTKYKATYYSYAKYTGSSYKEGSGKWEYKTTSTPLKKTKKIDGHQQYEGYWYNENVSGGSGSNGKKTGSTSQKSAATSKPNVTPKPSSSSGSSWGAWSGWSTTPVSASSTRQVETKQENKTASKTTYSYSRWSYYNTAYNTTYYSYAKYTGSSYKEGSGKWEYKNTSEPLSKTKTVSGHQQYKGYWYNQKVNTEETTTTVTYYRYRDQTD